MYNECLRRVGRATVHRIEPLDDIEMGLATKTMPIRQEMIKLCKLLHYQNDSNILLSNAIFCHKALQNQQKLRWRIHQCRSNG